MIRMKASTMRIVKKNYLMISFYSAMALAAALALMIFSRPATAGPIEKIDIPFDVQRLEKGELQVFTHAYALEKGGRGKRVVGVMLINAPPEQAWKVLENWEAMGDDLPGLEYYKTMHVVRPVTDEQAGESYIEGKLNVGFLSILYTLRVTFDKAGLWQRWELVDEEAVAGLRARKIPINPPSATLSDIRGFEYIEPYGDGSRTIYYYAPIVEVSMPVPDWVERKLSKSSLNEYMEGVKKKVEEGR